MSRVVVELPGSFPFDTLLEVRTEHINRGNHLGNDRLVSFLNEARVQFLPEEIRKQASEELVLINADLALVFRSEAFYGEVLRVQVAPGNFHSRGFDLFFRVTEQSKGREVARAKMAMLLFDFNKRELASVSGNPEQYFIDWLGLAV